MPSAASWERNSSLDSWHVAEIEYPGVYVEEVPLGVAPIAGVETSTAGDVHDGLHRREVMNVRLGTLTRSSR